jgi:hypothetical protein
MDDLAPLLQTLRKRTIANRMLLLSLILLSACILCGGTVVLYEAPAEAAPIKPPSEIPLPVLLLFLLVPVLLLCSLLVYRNAKVRREIVRLWKRTIASRMLLLILILLFACILFSYISEIPLPVLLLFLLVPLLFLLVPVLVCLWGLLAYRNAKLRREIVRRVRERTLDDSA